MMLRKLLPVVLSLVAFLGGAAGGEMLRRGAPAEAADGQADPAAGDHEAGAEHGTTPGTQPPPVSAAYGAPQGPGGPAAHGGASAAPDESTAHGGSGGHGSPGGHDEAGAGTAWFEFPQQFFVPILYDGRLDSTMILTLSAEMPDAARETVYAHEIKLRDALLRQLLIHANTGGFDGNFTSEAQLRKLRGSLTATAQGVVPEIAGILIGAIARQDR